MIDYKNDLDFQKFCGILKAYGHKLSANAYDNLDEYGKPQRRALERKLGEPWSVLKVMALNHINDFVYADNVDILRSQNKSLSERIKKLKNTTNLIIDTLKAELLKMGPVEPIPVPPKRTSKENLIFCGLRSDTHPGELVDEKWTQGLGKYNSDIYEQRSQKWFEKIANFHMQDKDSLGLNKLMLFYLGDVSVTGERIFQGQPFHIDLDLCQQLFLSFKTETRNLLSLSSIFNEIEVFCVPGNHGRPGKKGEYSDRTNFDYIMYWFMHEWLKDCKNIKIFVSESPTMIIEEGEYKFALNHGDNVQHYMGIPFYGRERAFSKLSDLYKLVIHYNLVGHHHEPSNLGDRIIINGSQVGGSDFSIHKLMRASAPSQKIFYFHPKHGINRETNIILAPKMKLEPDEHGIYTHYKKNDG